MGIINDNYTVKQLAKLAGVSVRTLHYYDQIGLLTPSIRTDANYRLCGEAELLRLQQILFYKELDMPLQQICDILNEPDFDDRNLLFSTKGKEGTVIMLNGPADTDYTVFIAKSMKCFANAMDS